MTLEQARCCRLHKLTFAGSLRRGGPKKGHSKLVASLQAMIEQRRAGDQNQGVALESTVSAQLESMGHEVILKLPMLNARTPGVEELKLSREAFRAGKKVPRERSAKAKREIIGFRF